MLHLQRSLEEVVKSTPTAIANVKEAAALVEQAQHILERACQKISSVRNGAPLWRKVGKLTDQAHGALVRPRRGVPLPPRDVARFRVP